jgi:ATP-dependent Clp protease protease subunit
MAKTLTKDWLDALFEYGIDKKNRRIFLFDDIDLNSIGKVIKALYLLDSESNKPIELFISSFGGGEYDMYLLYDTIQTIHSPIYTVAMGKCMSAAPLLIACGENGFRYATPNTWFMVHQGWDEFGAKRYDELKKDIAHLGNMESRWYQLMELHTNKNGTFWKLQCEKVGDKYFNVKEAQEWGLIDQIWTEKQYS